jgi:hypothetical protein
MTGSSDREDPFARVAAAAADTSPTARDSAKLRSDAQGEPVLPVPATAPPPLGSHKAHGQPSAQWAYRDANGGLLGYVCRFDKPDGSKVVLPQTLWREGGKLRWSWKAFPEPRPLYGLQQLAERPAAPVLIVEGEKTAEAARDRLPGFVVVTWSGGSRAAGKSDWSGLAGRDAIIWPDADEPGRKAAQDVARLTTAAGVLTVSVAEPPRFFPEGWDLADAWPEGFGQRKAEAVIADAQAKAQPGGVEWPWGFRMDEDGFGMTSRHKTVGWPPRAWRHRSKWSERRAIRMAVGGRWFSGSVTATPGKRPFPSPVPALRAARPRFGRSWRTWGSSFRPPEERRTSLPSP